ncbi:eukaryotic translation initiation factor 4E (nucleomorph) [Cryptomonas paramecium]|uniref:Eukaryotic translation initiation factor 4E n=1 Tax=Cryptomonas paramaecium TaxID=2898 RepID=F2HIE5_9CRYP|nr:eukaryotic translation initiation factor 4E [Cryptomonas paramecium]AEA39069.1 eukaryotic translation initiation factor 4E [Cryptomonas paramecium]|mmetsp:Transcript_16867/g.46112  ORF Transcript_16867/g.46112 Transcript_16867/m.46112 type:complete len:192 (-) Transcript_16867:3148-3723(-)
MYILVRIIEMNLLNQKWTFWFDALEKNVLKHNWDQFLFRIDSFEDVENFLKSFSGILQPSSVCFDVNIQMFKFGIEPKWEDIHNLNGGKWVLTISDKQFIPSVDVLWERTIIAIITQASDIKSIENINGIVLNIKKNFFRISIWTTNFLDEVNQIKIGKSWKKLIKKIHTPSKLHLEYFPHTNQLFKKKMY